MNFAVRLIDLKRQPFLWVPAEPAEITIGKQRYRTLICIDLATDSIRVELRPTTKKKETGHAKP